MNNEEPRKMSLGMRLAFACGEVGDNVALNTFTFLIFTYYFTVVRIPAPIMTLGFILWALWNAFNDPLIGYLSDRTKSRWGRRIPWMIGATIPLGVLMILLFTPPGDYLTNQSVFIYFIIILILFDFAYTSFNLNYNSLFSEMFVDMKERSSTGRIRIIFVLIATMFALTFPTFIIEDITNKDPLIPVSTTITGYQITGIVAAIIIFVFYFLILKWGVKDPKHISKDAESAMSFTKTLKFTFKHKSFLWFLFPALGTWLVINILPTLSPLFFVYAVGIEDEFLIGILLMISFLVAAVSTPLWELIRVKKGARLCGLIGIVVWLVSVVCFAYSVTFEMALIFMIFFGVGLGGGLYFYDQCIAEIIDEDEITYGIRRSGIYYAVLNFLIRLSMILNFVIIGLVFTSTDWMNYTPNPGVDVILGLRILMGIYPGIVLGLSLIGMYFYPIKGERLAENRRKLTELHKQKLGSV
ncbi:MAG: MFS transporter [Candidatus Lokiarchaeota archaeon]|nr:MFS transporter [Candidatus Lokiarchaeota archaeon]